MEENRKTVAVIEYDDAGIENMSHLIRDVKVRADVSNVIMISSGAYMQNGLPAARDESAAVDAYEKAGADLILELPLCSMLGGYGVPLFAAAALISRLRCVDEIILPVFDLDDETMRRLAILLFQEPVGYQKEMKQLLAAGLTIPEAQAKAADNMIPGAEAILSNPVNRRAVEIRKYLFQLFCCIPAKGLEQGQIWKTAKPLAAGKSEREGCETPAEKMALEKIKDRLHSDAEAFFDELSQIPGYSAFTEERIRSLEDQLQKQTDFETCLAMLEPNARRRDDLRLCFLRYHYGITKLDQQICAMHTWCPDAKILAAGNAAFTEQVKAVSWTELI